MSVKAELRGDGIIEWVNVGEGDDAAEWVHIERPGRTGLAQAKGAFERVELVGSLFDGDDAPVSLGTIHGGGMTDLLYAASRVKPIVSGGTATIRLAVPKG